MNRLEWHNAYRAWRTEGCRIDGHPLGTIRPWRATLTPCEAKPRRALGGASILQTERN